MAASLLACGIDTNKSILFQQSQVRENYWSFLNPYHSLNTRSALHKIPYQDIS